MPMAPFQDVKRGVVSLDVFVMIDSKICYMPIMLYIECTLFLVYFS